MIRPRRRTRQGLTLIELLIVVVVIGVLAAMAIPKFGSVKRQAYRSQVIADLTSLRTAEEGYFADSSRYASLAEIIPKLSTTRGLGTPSIVTGTGFWSATLTHPHIPGVICGISVGVANPVITDAGEGEPVCK